MPDVGDAKQNQPVGQHRDNQRADQRAPYAADAADEAGAPQDDRSDPESDEEKAEPGPALAQLQVKEISSSDEEDSDEEEDAEPPADDKPMAMRVRDFIAAYCAQHKMQKTHRWTPVREQILQGEIIAAGLNIMVEDMKKMINSHFGP